VVLCSGFMMAVPMEVLTENSSFHVPQALFSASVVIGATTFLTHHAHMMSFTPFSWMGLYLELLLLVSLARKGRLATLLVFKVRLYAAPIIGRSLVTPRWRMRHHTHW